MVIAKLEDENTNLKQKLKYYVDKFKKLVNHFVHKMFKKDREIYHDVAVDLYDHDILGEDELNEKIKSSNIKIDALKRKQDSLYDDKFNGVIDSDTYKRLYNIANDEIISLESRQTLTDYISVLDSLHLISNLEAYSLNYRSSDRVGKSAKRHLVDPSLACACLNLTEKKLMYDHKTFGYLFEALVTRDLRIYADYLDGNVFHFRDNLSRDEVDAIIELDDGEYGAFEIKLTPMGLEDGKKSLLKFYENVKKKPKFMCIILGYAEAIIKDKETGIYIIPITALKP